MMIDLEQRVFDAYAEGFRDGIVEGTRRENESLAREPTRHVIDQSYDASNAKLALTNTVINAL